jgi:Cu/Ag efflux protein CusF
MRFRGIVVFAIASCLVSGFYAQAQTAASTSQTPGTVTAVDAAARHVTMKSDKNEEMAVEATERTVVVRVPPGETDPKKFLKISLSDLAPGDRIVAFTKTPIQGKTIAASSIVVMSKADVAKTHEQEQEDWKKRGTTGNVTAIDAAGKTVTLKVGSRTVIVKMGEKTDYHRYSPDSARFEDSTVSNFAAIKTGDQVKALGNKDPDGVVQAEKVVFGAFRQIAATIISIDAATGEMKVKDLAAAKNAQPLTIRVNTDSTMKKLPPMMATMLARRYAPGAQQGDGAGRGPGRGPGGEGGGPGGRGGRDLGQQLDNLPAMPLSELKPGDAIMVTTTIGSDPSRVTATMLLAGVEPLLTASPNATRDIMSGWNLGGGGGGEGQ